MHVSVLHVVLGHFLRAFEKKNPRRDTYRAVLLAFVSLAELGSKHQILVLRCTGAGFLRYKSWYILPSTSMVDSVTGLRYAECSRTPDYTTHG